MHWPKTGATRYHTIAQLLGLLDEDRAIKELVVCWVLQVIGQKME